MYVTHSIIIQLICMCMITECNLPNKHLRLELKLHVCYSYNQANVMSFSCRAGQLHQAAGYLHLLHIKLPKSLRAREQQCFLNVFTVTYLLEVFVRLWIPSLVCVYTSVWSQHQKLQSKILCGFMTLATHPHQRAFNSQGSDCSLHRSSTKSRKCNNQFSELLHSTSVETSLLHDEPGIRCHTCGPPHNKLYSVHY